MIYAMIGGRSDPFAAARARLELLNSEALHDLIVANPSRFPLPTLMFKVPGKLNWYVSLWTRGQVEDWIAESRTA